MFALRDRGRQESERQIRSTEVAALRGSIERIENFVANRRALGNTSGRMTAEMLIESGTALIGSPKTVLAGIDKMRERTGFGVLVCLLQFGILSDELTRRNMDMFAGEVMPRLRS